MGKWASPILSESTMLLDEFGAENATARNCRSSVTFFANNARSAIFLHCSVMTGEVPETQIRLIRFSIAHSLPVPPRAV